MYFRGPLLLHRSKAVYRGYRGVFSFSTRFPAVVLPGSRTSVSHHDEAERDVLWIKLTSMRKSFEQCDCYFRYDRWQVDGSLDFDSQINDEYWVHDLLYLDSSIWVENVMTRVCLVAQVFRLPEICSGVNDLLYQVGF